MTAVSTEAHFVPEFRNEEIEMFYTVFPRLLACLFKTSEQKENNKEGQGKSIYIASVPNFLQHS